MVIYSMKHYDFSMKHADLIIVNQHTLQIWVPLRYTSILCQFNEEYDDSIHITRRPRSQEWLLHATKARPTDGALRVAEGRRKNRLGKNEKHGTLTTFSKVKIVPWDY
jgi:hypothetical protein